MKSNKNIITYHTNIALTIFAMSLFVFLMSVFFVQTDFHVSKIVTIGKHLVHAEGGEGGAEGGGNGEGSGGGSGGGAGESGSGSGSESGGGQATGGSVGNGEGTSGNPGGVSGESGGGCCGGAPAGNGEGSSGAPGGVSGESGGGCCSPDNDHTDTTGELHQEPPVDVCPNISGNQDSVPSGLVIDANGNCVPPPTDICPNIPGIQTTIPEGLILDGNGNCVPPPVIDICLNIDGNQASVPEGLIKDASGNCLPPPPTDLCPNLPGDQTTLPSGWSIDATGKCVPPSVCLLVPPVITSATSASGTVGSPFSYTITKTGGAPITLGLTGNLPAGLAFDAAAGVISGTPTTNGTFTVTITAHNDCGDDSKTLTITIGTNPVCSITPPHITSSLTLGGVVGTALSYTITASGGAPIAIAISGTLPAGLTFDAASSTISGTPTAAETQNITITATNPCGNDTQTLVITTSPPGGCTVNCGGGGCTVNCGGGGGCTSNCGGGSNPAAVFLYKVASSSPLASASIYLSQIPYTGFGDVALIFLFFAGLGLFSYNVSMFLSKRKWALLGTSKAIEFQSVYMAPQVMPVAAPVAQTAQTQVSAREIAHEMGTMFATILKDQSNEYDRRMAAMPVIESVPAPVPVSAKEIAAEVGAVISEIFKEQVTPHVQDVIEEKAPVTVNVSIGTIHVGNNITNNTTNSNNTSNTTNTTNTQLPVAEPIKVEAPKVAEVVMPVEVPVAVDNQLLIEALRNKANEERVLISPLGFDIIAIEAKQDSEAALSLIVKLINEAKATYPRQHGWIELNKDKVVALLTAIAVEVK